MISFTVPGDPISQGSMRHIGRGRMLHSNDRLKDYREAIGWGAKAAGAKMIDGPVAVEIAFYLARPKSHLRKDGTLKGGAPVFPTSAPDLDKFSRACL